MDLRLKTGSRPNPVWEIHWTLTGQTHLYGWVDIQGIHFRVTVSRKKHGGRIEIGLGNDPPTGRAYTVVDNSMQLPEELIPYLNGPVTVSDIPTEGVLSISSVPFVSMAEQSAWDEYYASLKAGETVYEPDPPKRDFFNHQVLAADFNQTDTDAIFTGFGFRSHVELADEND